jgi:hypothetical protein
MDIRDPHRIPVVGRVFERVGLFQQRRALDIGGQHRVQQSDRAAGRFLRHRADARAGRHADLSAIDAQHAGQQLQKGRFAGPVGADQTGLMPRRNARARILQQRPPGDSVSQIVDLQHAPANTTSGGRQPTGDGAAQRNSALIGMANPSHILHFL